MATVQLLASAYTCQSENITVTNPTNAYTDTESDTYATVLKTTTTAEYVYFHGFNFSLIPENAEVTAMEFKIKGLRTYATLSVILYDKANNTALSSSKQLPSGSTPGVITITPQVSISDILAVGDDFAFGVTSFNNHEQYVYGMEINVTYKIPSANKVTYNGNTLIDLTADTVTITDVLNGKTFHLPSGEIATGTGVGGLEYESGSFTPTSDVRQPTISFNNTHDTPPSLIAMWRASSTTQSSNPAFFLGFVNSTWGDSPYVKGLHSFFYWGSSGSLANYTGEIQYDGSNSYGGIETYWRFWATETAMTPQTNSSSYPWRKNTLYHWLAIWSQPLFT